MTTEDFVNRLALTVTPVRPLRRPWTRAAFWTLGTGLYLGVLTLVMASSDDFAANTIRPLFVAQQLLAIATSVIAAGAALGSVVPGHSKRAWLLLVLVASAWFASILVELPNSWNAVGLAGLAIAGEWPCVVMIVVGGMLPAIGLAYMLRRGAPMTPRLTTGLSAVAAAGLASVVACVSEPHPNGLVVLVWHGGAVLALACLASGIGRYVLPWRFAHRATS
jgi:hypothetical protein